MMIPWILISILVLLVLFAVFGIYAKKKYKRPVDYYNFFVIGMIWAVIGIPLHNYVLTIIGIVFMVTGLVNKDKWESNRRTWKDLPKGERKLVMWLTIILGLLVLAGLIAMLLVV